MQKATFRWTLIPALLDRTPYRQPKPPPQAKGGFWVAAPLDADLVDDNDNVPQCEVSPINTRGSIACGFA